MNPAEEYIIGYKRKVKEKHEMNPVEQYGPDALSQHIIDSWKGEFAKTNRYAIMNYGAAVARVKFNNEWWAAVNPRHKPEQMPDLPQIQVVDEDKVRAMEGGDTSIDVYSGWWHWEEYNPPTGKSS